MCRRLTQTAADEKWRTDNVSAVIRVLSVFIRG